MTSLTNPTGRLLENPRTVMSKCDVIPSASTSTVPWPSLTGWISPVSSIFTTSLVVFNLATRVTSTVRPSGCFIEIKTRRISRGSEITTGRGVISSTGFEIDRGAGVFELTQEAETQMIKPVMYNRHRIRIGIFLGRHEDAKKRKYSIVAGLRDSQSHLHVGNSVVLIVLTPFHLGRRHKAHFILSWLCRRIGLKLKSERRFTGWDVNRRA